MQVVYQQDCVLIATEMGGGLMQLVYSSDDEDYHETVAERITAFLSSAYDSIWYVVPADSVCPVIQTDPEPIHDDRDDELLVPELHIYLQEDDGPFDVYTAECSW